MKTLVQCDFDGTITEEDVSFFLLDEFADGDWRSLLRDYREHRISVGRFNTQAFAMVKADWPALVSVVKNKAMVRAGFSDLVAYCSQRNFRLVIVSNGLEFYIKEILGAMGLDRIEVYAAQTRFNAGGLKVQYIGPGGEPLDDGLKESYIKSFIDAGYRITYVGNGESDVEPARYADQVIARDELLAYFRGNGLKCQPFDDLNDVVQALELLPA